MMNSLFDINFRWYNWSKNVTVSITAFAGTSFRHIFLSIDTGRLLLGLEISWFDIASSYFSLESVSHLFDIRFEVLLGIWHLLFNLLMLLLLFGGCFKCAQSDWLMGVFSVKFRLTIFLFLLCLILDQQRLLVSLCIWGCWNLALIHFFWTLLLLLLQKVGE